jgi:O-methyltransferase
LDHLYPLVAAGGVLILDDYGHWDGARRAVDEYFADLGTRPLLCRTDYTGRIGTKPSW